MTLSHKKFEWTIYVANIAMYMRSVIGRVGAYGNINKKELKIHEFEDDSDDEEVRKMALYEVGFPAIRQEDFLPRGM